MTCPFSIQSDFLLDIADALIINDVAYWYPEDQTKTGAIDALVIYDNAIVLSSTQVAVSSLVIYDNVEFVEIASDCFSVSDHITPVAANCPIIGFVRQVAANLPIVAAWSPKISVLGHAVLMPSAAEGEASVAFAVAANSANQISLVDGIYNAVVLADCLAENLSVAARIVYEPIQSTVYVFNTATLGATQYSIPAIDVTVVDGAVQFLTAEGVVSLGGDLDGPSYIETGDLGLSGGAVCNLPLAYLVVQTNEALKLRATWVQGESRSMEYSIPARSGDGARARTVPMGKGPRGNEWRLRVASAGGDWTLGGVEVMVDRVGRVR